MTLFKGAFAPSKLATSSVTYQRCCLLMSAMQEYLSWRFGHRHDTSWPLSGLPQLLFSHFITASRIVIRLILSRRTSHAARLLERPVTPCFLAVCGRCYLFCFSPMLHQANKLLSLVSAPAYWVAVRLYWPVSPPPR